MQLNPCFVSQAYFIITYREVQGRWGKIGSGNLTTSPFPHRKDHMALEMDSLPTLGPIKAGQERVPLWNEAFGVRRDA